MKISIGSPIVDGPWGGGNLFLINLKNYLQDHGHDVLFDLKDPGLDIILFTDPRTGRGSTSNYGKKDIKRYLKKNNKVKVVQRINECDQRKNTKNINKLYLSSSDVADHIVFVSSWLEAIYLNLGMNDKKTSVILSGSDSKIFNSIGKSEKLPGNKYKLLTHHWSANWMKGFELYTHIDNLLSQNVWKDKIEFTYIGNIDKKYGFKNTKIITPLSGIKLAEEIKRHDIYVTGSVNEPSGNHHIESSLCGLPILYINSGGIPEYAQNYGLEVTVDSFTKNLDYMIDNYTYFQKKMLDYPFNSEIMCKEYLDLFERLIILT